MATKQNSRDKRKDHTDKSVGIRKNYMKRKTPKNKPVLNLNEQRVAKILIKSKIKLTTSQIAQLIELDWRTTKKSLEGLYRKAPISRQTLGNRIYWFVKK